jgi:hypothetical protein
MPGAGAQPVGSQRETYNPWTVVNLVFNHLASQGLHPLLGDTGDPGRPAADLLRALGITPAAEGSRQQAQSIQVELEQIRIAVFGEE